MSMSADLWTVAEAIRQLPSVCLYHGDDFGRSGYMGPRDGGRPRCDTCLPAWRRMCGMAALGRLEGTIDGRRPPRREPECIHCDSPARPGLPSCGECPDSLPEPRPVLRRGPNGREVAGEVDPPFLPSEPRPVRRSSRPVTRAERRERSDPQSSSKITNDGRGSLTEDTP